MDWTEAAKETGFEYACGLNTENLLVRCEVREMCAADRCRSYGKSWSCPPACGSLEHSAERIASYRSGVLVQTVGELEDEFDLEGIARASREHALRFARLVRRVKSVVPDAFPLSAGACMRCAACTYPSKPCRFPEKMFPSMEAYGLLVSDVCERSGLAYNHGPDTITFTSCILID